METTETTNTEEVVEVDEASADTVSTAEQTPEEDKEKQELKLSVSALYEVVAQVNLPKKTHDALLNCAVRLTKFIEES